MADFSEFPILGERFAKALGMAAAWHRFQVRKDGTPYIAHLIQVAGLVLESGGTEDQGIAGLLHDAVEDAGVTLELIEREFGPSVREIVAAVTQDGSLDGQPEDRNLAYAEAVNGCEPALLVSLADKLHNLRGYCNAGAEFRPQHRHLYQIMLPIYEAGIDPIPMLQELRALWERMPD